MCKNTALIFVISFLLLGRTNQESVQCGRRTINHPEKDSWYFGDMYPGQWPWSSAIYARKDNRTVEFICGGALISRRHVITSRLCVTGEDGLLLDAENVLIRLGTIKHNVVNVGKAKHRFVMKIHQPVEYDVTSRNQIVLLEMNEEVQFNEYVQPVCINRFKEFTGRNPWTIGWGVEKEHTHLGAHWDFVNVCTKTQIDYRNEICQADRGSFAYALDLEDKFWYISGIINCGSISCKDDNLNGFTNVADYLSFIIKITNLEYCQRVRTGQRFDPSQKYPNLLPQRNCGHTLIRHVKNSSNSQLYEFPWIAQLGFFDKTSQEWKVLCLGTLISYRYVLTNGKCVYYGSVKSVRLGEYNVNQDPDCSLEDKTECSLPMRDYDVEYSVIHSEDHGKNYVALVRTKKDVRFEDHIHPVCLPVSPELRQLQLPDYVAAGWNLVERNSPILQKTSLIAEQSYRCNNVKKIDSLEAPPDRFFCTIFNYTNFNSYVPLGQYVYINGMRFVQLGQLHIDNWAGFSLHINVSYFMNWIVANIKD